jgi:pimeloyl-ACP methyl ester carboxylesterase
MKRIRTAALEIAYTAALEIAYEESGPAAGRPVILLHGFPDDVRAYDGVAPPLAERGWRVFVPYLRGYGPTRFLDPATPRSGQQAALGRDLADFMDALGLERAVLVGYDWGGRAACIVAALWPQRVAGLVTIGGYNIQNNPEYRRGRKAGFARDRVPPLVPMVLPHRARTGGFGGEPGPAVPAAMGTVVAQLPL